MSDEINIGDRVVIINAHGLRIEGTVVAINDNHGLKSYRVASDNFSLTVERPQIVEVHNQ